MKKGIFVLLVMLFASCDKEPELRGTTFTFLLKNHSEIIEMDSVYTMVDGRNYAVQKFRIYLSNFKFHGHDTKVYTYDTILLLTNHSSFNLAIQPENFHKISFNVGIDSVTNHIIDPLTLPDNHPLSLSQEMFWDMTRYRFVFWEGLYSNSADGSGIPNAPYTFHLGRDASYRLVELPTPSTNKDAYNLFLDLSKVMYNSSDTLSLSTTFSNHSNDSEMGEAMKIMDNLAQAFSIE